jgi:phosphohistidine phosphatase
MKKVILIRHAKSSWDFPLDDFQRPLLPIGVARAKKVAHHFKKQLNLDSLFISSPALRALKTAEIFLSIWDVPYRNCNLISNLYTFSVAQLEEIVKSCPNNQNSVILFGHNSAITDFVNKFGDSKILNVPTAGLVEIVFDSIEWKSIKKGKISTIIFPKDL